MSGLPYPTYHVQTRRRIKQRWRTRWVFHNLTQAVRWYESLNAFDPWVKRLIEITDDHEIAVIHTTSTGRNRT